MLIHRPALICAALCVALASPVFAAPPAPSSVSPGALLAPAQWTQTLNGGTVTAGDGVIVLHGDGKGYPVLHTKQDPFPTSGDWTASLGYRYSSTGNYGTEIRCERADGSGAVVIHQDTHGQFLSLDGKPVWQISPNQDWHLLSLVRQGDRISAWVDGKPVGDMAAGAPLTAIRIGGGLMDKPWDWNDLELAHLTITPSITPLVAPSAAATLPPVADVPHTIAVPSSEKVIYCQPGDTLVLTGHYVSNAPLVSSVFSVGDKNIASRAADGKDDAYTFSWRAPSAGDFLLSVGYQLTDGSIAHVRRLNVSALPAPPIQVVGLPSVPVADTAISFAPQPSVFRAAQVNVHFNGQTLPTDASHSFRVTLPLGALPKGRYPLSFDAYDGQGGHWNSSVQTVEVPERLQVVLPPSVTLDTRDSRPLAQVSTAAGVAPVFVVYQVNGRTVAASDSDGFVAGLPLSGLKSGSYPVRAVALGIDGHALTSPEVSVGLTNTPEDQAEAEADKAIQASRDKAAAAAAAQAAVQDADARVIREENANIAAGFIPRAGMDVTLFRKQVADLAYNDPTIRTGAIGTAHGLSVLYINGKPDSGQFLTIDAIVRAGTGQTNFLAFSEEDSRVAAQQAAECCKRMTGLMGYRWDWSKYDLTIGYRENDIQHAGPSAGAADAVAIMSAVFSKPVDDSVAMTGAISLQGNILPVGGVDFKAEAALSDPRIRTLLIPAGTASLTDIEELYSLEPKLFMGKQIVLISTLSDALHYALIGWDNGDYVRSQKVLQRGIQLFGAGKDADAQQSFALAKSLAPQNTAPAYWSRMILAVERVTPAATVTSITH